MRILKPSRQFTSAHKKSEQAAKDADDPFGSEDFDNEPDEILGSKKGPSVRSTEERARGLSSDNPEAQRKKEFSRLWASGIRLLSMREHSHLELAKKLSAKSEQAEIVYAVLDELVDQNYQSDSRFTESFVRSRAVRGFGPIKIKAELKSKAIKISMIDEYLDANSAVWYENAASQYEKKYGTAPVTDYTSWTKRARFMQSRGFSMEHIHTTVPPVQAD